jgi:hypothetical protein
MLLASTALGRYAHARGHLRLVNIQRRWALDNRLHAAPFDRSITETAAQGPR